MASSGGGSNGVSGPCAASASSPSSEPLLLSPLEGACPELANVPQWKRELIQRRRQQQQSKVLAAARSSAGGSAATTSYGAAGHGGGAAAAATAAAARATDSQRRPSPRDTTSSTPGDDAAAAVSSASSSSTATAMRLEAAPDAPPAASPSSGDAPDELVVNGRTPGPRAPTRPSQAVLDIVEMGKAPARQEDCESDSSEELQYGPGIVHKLRSKYLNMTLREMNKNRTSVQCFRRAASLEDLLDHKEDSPDKARRYAKKNVTGTAAKVQERYRNAARGNESMKRARSVETLMRYNSAPEELPSNHTSRFVSSAFKQENDHIILVDRTTVKIESRLGDQDRLKPVNKPKRIKPVLAETERPPQDLVKTTMRIFESSSVKKLKPKGEVAAKVATFKTINDTFKAQNQKKIIPKPPLQPKPFVNGNSKLSTSPRKIILTRKPTAELIETKSHESYRDGVITDSIVQSVSSVVSKFQQIEKSQSPIPSPEPTFNKIRFSPIPSPEPMFGKSKVSCLDIKSPTSTPTPSPRTSPPKPPLSPLSPKTEIVKPPSPFLHKPVLNSTPLVCKIEQSKYSPSSEVPKLEFEKEKSEPVEEEVKETMIETNNQNTETISEVSKISESSSSLDSTVLVESFDEPVEVVDSPRTISKSALDNIGKAGMTVQFSFKEPPTIKSYLPRSMSTPQQMEDKTFDSDIESPRLSDIKSKSLDSESVPVVSDIITTDLEAESMDEFINKEDSINTADSKPIGAISSLSLIKSTTTTTFPQGNESKTIKSQKSETNSPPQKQIGIIRPLVSTKTQLPQQNLSNREIEKNLINRVKSIEQPTKVVVSLKSAEEIQPVKKNNSSGGLWDSKPWNQQNNTMVFNFSNRKDVPDYIENDGLIIKRKRDKPRQSSDSGGVIVSSLDSVQVTDDSDSEYSIGPPSPCDVSFLNDNVLINGRSNLSRTPRNHKHRIQFDDTATRTFEYPSEASMLEPEGGGTSSVDGETSASGDAAAAAAGASAARPTGTLPSLLGGGGLASYTPSKVDLASEGFELGVTRASVSTLASPQSPTMPQSQENEASVNEIEFVKSSQDPWGQETAADMLY